MSRINRNPRGLLSLLGLFQGGQVPTDLGTLISPTLDLTRLYLVDAQVALSAVWNPVPSNGPLFAPTTGSLVVPQGELWVVHWVHSTIITPAASTATFAPAVRVDNISGYLAPPEVAIASQTRWNPMSVSLPLYLKGGDALGIVITDLTGAAVIAGVTCAFSRLRA